MRIALGADHGGFELKGLLAAHIKRLGHEVVDLGTSSNEAVDYPKFARAVGLEVADGRSDRGIMIDGAGIGSAMVANKVPGVRAALAYDISSARNSREHNNANVLTLGAGLIGPRLAEQIVSAFLETNCTEERHLRRVAQIEEPGVAPPPIAGGAGGRPPRAPDPTVVSEDDLERIARELQRLLGDTGLRGPRVSEDPEAARRFLRLGVQRIGCGLGEGRVPDDIAAYIDHTILKADATSEQIRKLCAEAREYHFAAVCINPLWVPVAAAALRGSPVKVCSVVGFPLGATAAENKALETRRAIREGASEIDMVIQIGALKEGNDAAVLHDIRAVVEACRDGGAICKVIIEAAYLTDDEKRRACRLSRRAAAHFVKTSTGFGPSGATAHDVALMLEEVADARMEVKAAGGIRTYADAMKMIEAGATRIGASAGIAIVQESKSQVASA
jgi:deoxyribose-phosphate aldolase